MSADPTRSKTKRDRFEREFRKRWRALRGDLRSEFQGGSDFRPQNTTPPSRQLADFREWFEALLDDHVVEPMPQHMVRNGSHYSAPYVRNFYEHGIKQANRSLEQAGYDVGDASPEAITRTDHHQETLRGEYLETYQDVEDAARATETEATREYRSGVREGAAVAVLISRLNGRADAVGRRRTELVAQAKSIQTINDAAVERYADAGVEQVSAQIETGFGIEVEPESDAGADDREPKQAVRTAGDDRVCTACRRIARNGPYTLSEIRENPDLIPPYEHPGCRCFLVAVPPGDEAST